MKYRFTKHDIVVPPIDLMVQERFPDYIECDGIMWAKIKEYGNTYYVSEDGRVASYNKEEPCLLSVCHNQQGHEYVQLYFRGKGKKCSVHRLVAAYFVDNHNNYPVVRHLNDIPDDNYYENLAWGTQKDNYTDMVRNEHAACFKPVYCYETNQYYKSCAEAAYDFGVSRSDITLCCQGKNHSVRGRFHLCYASDVDKCLSLSEGGGNL